MFAIRPVFSTFKSDFLSYVYFFVSILVPKSMVQYCVRIRTGT